MLSLYIHIPFCIKKCHYCDFLSFPAKEETKNAYMAALLTEIEREAPAYEGCPVDTVFIGGGTPSALEAFHIENLMERLKERFALRPEAEISIEVNPGTCGKEKLLRYREAGINRISIGTQSLREEELRSLGRIHGVEEFYDTFAMARAAGFGNINVDLMAALPGQTLESYRQTLEKAAALKPEHISAYSLIIEEGTPFYSLYGTDGAQKGKALLPLPDEEEERRMYEETERYLSGKGYHRYEISNYALEGRECRHNRACWTRKNYAGFGLGAASMIENVRWKNTPDIGKYLGALKEKACHKAGGPSIKEEYRPLDTEEQMEEFMFLGLRLTEGIERAAFEKAFHRLPEEVYGEVLKELYGKALLEGTDRIRLTPYGRDVSNYVMAQFLF